MMMNEFEQNDWRLLITPPAAGAWNMAVDEAILEGVIAGTSPPTLRLYAWNPPCISLGYAQPLADVDMEAVTARGWEVVRRPTGGRAILHTDELTYSVIAPADEPRLTGDILQSYQRISGALMRALQALSVPATHTHFKKDERTANNTQPVCFEVPGKYEITMDGKKLIGSAQARRKNGVLQHGTLPLFGDLTRITQALVFDSEEARQTAGERLLTLATTVENALDHKVSWQEAADAFVQGFSQQLNLHFTEGSLNNSESEMIVELSNIKYSNKEWLSHR